MLRRAFALAVALALGRGYPTAGSQASQGAASAPQTALSRAPKLIVLIVADQMRADYITRFRGDWTGGLKRLVSEGAWFSNAAYPYLLTDTCPGHATIATGAFPHTHGAIINEWWDRASGTRMSCTEDPNSTNVGYLTKAIGGDSGYRLQVPTFADEMRRQRGSRIVSVAGKDRAAIMLAGHAGDAVAWLSPTFDYWETSTAFSQASNGIVKSFLLANPLEADLAKTWDRMLAPPRYRSSDDDPDEGRVGTWGAAFPHVLSAKADAEFHEEWRRSPFADAYIGKLATTLAEGLRLGTGDSTDVLTISFSATDWVGHKFGPESQEVQDTLARLDAVLGTLFHNLDERVGRGNYVVALTADHGVTPIPEHLVKIGKDAGRMDVPALTKAIELQLAASLGPGKHVAEFFYANLNLYFAPGVYEKLKATPSILNHLMDTIARAPGVLRVLKAEELRPGSSNDSLRKAAELSYFPGRGGDLVVALKPGWAPGPQNTANHGSATDDDQRVPVLFMGPGVKPGERRDPVTPADIAPTLAALCGIAMPHAEGHALRLK